MRRLHLFALGAVLLLPGLTGCQEEDVLAGGLALALEGQKTAGEVFRVTEGQSITLCPLYHSKKELSFTWTIRDPQVAKAEDGVITGLGAGRTLLTVTGKEVPELMKKAYIDVIDRVHPDGDKTGQTKNDPVLKVDAATELTVTFIEMQAIYADAIYLQQGDLDILIDAGQRTDGPHVRDVVLGKTKDKILELVILTHGDGDHWGGMQDVLTAVDDVAMFIDCGGSIDNAYTKERDRLVSAGSYWHTAYDCVHGLNGATDRYWLTEELTVDVLNTGAYASPTQSAGNPQSVATIFTWRDFTFFTAGDLTSDSEKKLMKNETLTPVTLYKASHHGSKYSNTQAILNALDPAYIGISAAICRDQKTGEQTGVKGHPAGEAIKRMYQAPRISSNLNIYWNGVNGDMTFTSHGEKDVLDFHGSPTLKGYYYKSKNGEFVKVTGEEDLRLHESKVFELRGWKELLPPEAQGKAA